MQAYKEEFIRFMVRSGVLTFGDFTAKAAEKHRISSTPGTIKQVSRLQNSVSFMQAALKNTSKAATMRCSVRHTKAFRCVSLRHPHCTTTTASTPTTASTVKRKKTTARAVRSLAIN